MDRKTPTRAWLQLSSAEKSKHLEAARLARCVRTPAPMRALTILPFVLLTGCAVSSTESVYDLPTEKYEGTGGSTSAPGSGGGENGSTPTKCQAPSAYASFAGALAAFTAKDAVEVFDQTKAQFTFLMTDFAGACASGGTARPGSSVVAIRYGATELPAGHYDLTKTSGLTITYTRYDASCNVVQTETATSGTLTFDTLNECGGKGALDVMVGGQAVSASFAAPVCALASVAGACK
jgi:hypothetical protein